jgi:hypothetical protein
VDSDVKAEVVFAAKGPDSAKDLSGEIKDGLEQAKGIVAFLISQKKELAPLADVIDTIKVTTQGSTVTVKGHVDADLIEKAVKGKDDK